MIVNLAMDAPTGHPYRQATSTWPVRVGPQGAVVAERMSFTELTVEEGGKVRVQVGELFLGDRS